MDEISIKTLELCRSFDTEFEAIECIDKFISLANIDEEFTILKIYKKL